MSEANREEAKRCLDLAKKAFAAGNTAKALRLGLKSITLYPTEAARTFVAQTRKVAPPSPTPTAAASGSGGGGESASPSTRTFTPEQEKEAKKIATTKNLYDVLGVKSTASDAEIKKAYRKLAMKFHPDKCSAPSAEEAFKVIGNAYGTLSEEEKRKMYDQFGADESTGPVPRDSSGRPMYQTDVTPEDLFAMFFGAGLRRDHASPFVVHSRMYGFPPRRHRQASESDRGVGSLLFQLLPLILLAVMAIWTTSSSDSSSSDANMPLFVLEPTGRHVVHRRTPGFGIDYYVRGNFWAIYGRRPSVIRQIEGQVERLYISKQQEKCNEERSSHKKSIDRINVLYDGSERKKRVEVLNKQPMPACESLERIAVG